MAADFAIRLGWDSIQHERHGRAASLSLGEQCPRDGVRVPRCGRDEEPEVRSRKELAGDAAVRLHD